MRTHAAVFRVPARADAFEAALEGLTRVNEGLMQREHVPPLYEAGVRYKDEPRDVWRHALDVAADKWGDCEDLAAYRAAELRVSGEDPQARVVTYQSGPNRYHAVVARSGGLVEDPSRVLGMGQKKGGNMRPTKTTNLVGDDTTPAGAMSFEIIAIPGGWGRRAGYRGYLKLPVGFHPETGVPQALYSIGPQQPTTAAATKAVAESAATQLLKNPAVQAALSTIPGGAAAASVLANPALQNAAKDAAKGAVNAVKALKFW